MCYNFIFKWGIGRNLSVKIAVSLAAVRTKALFVVTVSFKIRAFCYREF